MKSTKMAQSTQSARPKVQDLDVRYGQIGISAVAAAMRYQGDAKTEAKTEAKTATHVSADRQRDRWLKAVVPEFAA
jgi:hypothetical protein